MTARRQPEKAPSSADRASTAGATAAGATATKGTYARIHAVVRRIPKGRVATYGQVAELAGLAGHARQAGYALHALSGDDRGVPWHRVLNAQGMTSPRSEPGGEHVQRQMLELEGVAFDARGRVDLERHRWRPRTRRA